MKLFTVVDRAWQEHDARLSPRVTTHDDNFIVEVLGDDPDRDAKLMLTEAEALHVIASLSSALLSKKR